ncbi:MAG: hypothetical protein IJF58_01205 [Clostridia bacterium]|nr:hypothetical protein [Clostridia bacterium]
MPTDFEKLIQKYADELMQMKERYPQSKEEQPQSNPATPYTEPTIPPQPTEMPVVLPGEPLEMPQIPQNEPPAVLPPLQSEEEEAPYIADEISDIPMAEKDPSNDDEGYIQIRAYTADKALPVEGALVAITSRQGSLVASMITDRDGLTPAVALKTVSRSESATSEGMDAYDTYNVEIIKNGFLDFINRDVPVFGGITNVQNAPLVPLPEISDVKRGEMDGD